MAKISIIIPVYFNEGELILMYEDLKKKALDTILEGGDEYEIIMIDDGSCDNSWSEMEQLFNKDNRIHLYRHARNFGEHSAILCGYTHCTGDCAVNKAGDMQEPSELIINMFSKWKQGYKVVFAVREKREESCLKRLFAGVYYWCTRKFVYKDMPRGGFNIHLLDRKAINVLLNMDETNAVLEGQILWMGFKSALVPYTRRARNIGKSRWTLRKKVKCFTDMIFNNTDFPIKTVAFLGGCISIISLVVIVFIVVKWLLVGESVEGWTSIFVLISLSLGIIMVTMSIIGNYVWRCFESVKNKPVFIIEQEKHH